MASTAMRVLFWGQMTYGNGNIDGKLLNPPQESGRQYANYLDNGFVESSGPTKTEVEVAIAAVSKSRRSKAMAVVAIVIAIVVASVVVRVVTDSMRPDPLIGTWGYSTMGIVDSDSARLSETQLGKFNEAKSFAALVMQGFYITVNEDGNATVEAFGRKIGATWKKTGDADYVIELVSASQDSDQRVALSSIDVNSERMKVKLVDDGKLEVENDEPTTPEGYRTYTVFEKVDPADKVENALFNSADELKESMLAQTLGGRDADEEADNTTSNESAASEESGDAASDEKSKESEKSKASSASAQSSGSASSAASEKSSVADDASQSEPDAEEPDDQIGDQGYEDGEDTEEGEEDSDTDE